MASLALLPASTVHRIASSQVITSVSTAVKELVENSLDAGADNVEVKLEGYGLTRIEIRDNGCGINTSDAEVMAQRHYTSKIKSFENLNELRTYGFRGEALCSLCAVGDVTITTKTKNNAVAQCYTLGQRGKIRSKKPTPSSNGTIIVVSNLFKNLPVRKQFLSSTKKCKDELKKVEELVMAFGAVHPSIRIVLWHNKSIVWQKSKVSDYRTSLMSVFGTSVMAHMDRIDCKNEDSGFEVVGYLPKPTSDPNITCRTNNDRGFVFVNNRPVVMKDISQLVRQHYSLAGSKYPFMFVSITLPPDEVDVNLEPNKTRVLLTEKEQLLEAIKSLLEKFYGHVALNKDNQLHADSSGPHKVNHLVSNAPNKDNNVSNEDSNRCAKLANTYQNIEEQGHVMDQINISELQIDGPFTPIASSTLSSTQCEILLEGTDGDLVEKNKTNIPSFCPLEALNIEERDVSHLQSQIDHHYNASNTVSSLNSDGCPSTLLLSKENNHIFNSNINKPNDKENFSQRVNSVNNSNFCSTKLPSDQGSNGAMFDNSKSTTYSANPGNIQGTANKELSKEDMENIYQLLDLTDDSQKPSDPKMVNGLLTGVSEKSSSLNFEDVFDDDVEFDQILQDIADKKTSSQPSQPGTDVAGAKVYDTSKTDCNDVCEKNWSTGTILKNKQGNAVEPVRLLAPLSGRPFNNTTPLLGKPNQTSPVPGKPHNQTTPIPGKRKHSNDNKSRKQSSSRKINSIPQIMNQSLITFQASQSPTDRLKQATKVDVSFSMLDLKKSYSMASNTKAKDTDLKNNNLIGRLEPSGVWLMLQQSGISYVNHCRIQEQILYHKLIQSHVLTSEKLDNPIHLSPRIVGGDACWDILVNLDTQSDLLSSARFIKDERIKSNGFEIRLKHDSDTDDLKVDLLSISTSLQFYGVPDLAEVLGLIKASDGDSCSLEVCRPLKVINYLKGEAVRICRAQRSRRSKEDVQSLLNQMEECLPNNVRNCLHEQPFFGQIANLSDLL